MPTDKSGNDVVLSWPAVVDAGSYLVRVYDLDTGMEVPCPASLDCTPATTTTTHAGALTGGVDCGYRVFAVDPCGEPSAN